MKTTSIAIALAAGFVLVACNKNEGSSGGSAPAAANTGATTPAAVAPAKGASGNTVVGIKPGELFAASCNTITSDGECGEIVATSEADKAKGGEAMKQLCTKGTASTDKVCPSEKMVGTCRVMKDIVNHYYADGPKAYTADTAKQKCEKEHGHWVQ